MYLKSQYKLDDIIKIQKLLTKLVSSIFPLYFNDIFLINTILLYAISAFIIKFHTIIVIKEI